MAFVTQGPAVEVDLVGLGAVAASVGMVGKGPHDVDLVVMWLARIDGGGREADLSLEGRHLRLHSEGFLGICRRRRRYVGNVIVGGDGVVRRHFESGSSYGEKVMLQQRCCSLDSGHV